MAELDLGRIRFFDKGEHSMETEYVLWDFVTGDGSTYLYTNKTGSTGKALTNGAYWKKLASGLTEAEINAVLIATQEANTATTQANDARDRAIATTDETVIAKNATIQATEDASTAAGLANTATSNAIDATNDAIIATTNANEGAVYAQEQGDYAKAQGEAIQDDLALKANHGYESNPKTLKQVEDEKADHGYASIDVAKTLKQVEDNASVKIENLMENGDFRDGLTGWISFGIPDTLSITDKLIFNGVASANGGVYTDIPSSINNKIYLKLKATNEGEAFPSVFIYAYDSFDNPISLDVSMKTASTIFNSLLGGFRLRFRQASGSTYINATIDDVICIDLTETFGKGNEPTKEEMDLLISILGIDYFEGEITIQAQKVMQWQLKLIRKNKNAIIALGGTII